MSVFRIQRGGTLWKIRWDEDHSHLQIVLVGSSRKLHDEKYVREIGEVENIGTCLGESR